MPKLTYKQLYMDDWNGGFDCVFGARTLIRELGCVCLDAQ
jgi:hypothetical protein